MEIIRVVGWISLTLGAIFVLGAIGAVLWFVFSTGVILLGGGKFTEGLGNLLVGTVVVVITLLLGVVALIVGFAMLAGT